MLDEEKGFVTKKIDDADRQITRSSSTPELKER